MVVGLPFPAGALHDPDTVTVMDGKTPLPTQTDITATWPDGSIRWALASFAGKPSQTYALRLGEAPPVSVHELTLQTTAAGGLVIDTGAARYVFGPQALLPEALQLGKTRVVTQGGAGAYLIDNQGREATVAGPQADVTSEIIRQGSLRAVVRRDGWYVTADGERVARARMWFYFHAGFPEVKMTHSLIFTRDTNELWVRDYGLRFPLVAPPDDILFPVGDDVMTIDPAGETVYMLQDELPHFRTTTSRAVVGRDSGVILREMEMAGEWGHARSSHLGVTLVVPELPQMFPKSIAFGPDAATVSLWSSRSGRELDLRAKTLVEGYWKSWLEGMRNEPPVDSVADFPTNAQGAARTHDIWLLPSLTDEPDHTIREAALALAQPSRVMVEPEWLTASEAIGWPMHPKDETRFPEEEAWIAACWDRLMSQYEALPRTGFMAWGGTPLLSTSKYFRLSSLSDYGMRSRGWSLYARSGEPRYAEFGERFNRYIGDWKVAHWTAPDKVIGGWAVMGSYDLGHLPFEWGNRTWPLAADATGASIHNWLLEYYLTGDEYVLELTRMVGDAMLDAWDDEVVRQGPQLPRWLVAMPMRILTELYTREWDPRFLQMAEALSKHLIVLDNPNGLSDAMDGGALYKWERNLHALYWYAKWSGDPAAREAFLQALDYHFRFQFDHPRGPFSSQNYRAFLYTIGYRWTGREDFLRLVAQEARDSFATSPNRMPAGPHANITPTFAIPTALGLLAEVERPIAPLPLARLEADQMASQRLLLTKGKDALQVGIYIKMQDEQPPRVELQPAVAFEQLLERAYQTTYKGRLHPTSYYLFLTLPEHTPPGDVQVSIPGAETIIVVQGEPESVRLAAAPPTPQEP